MHIVKGRLPALNEVVTVFGPEGELLILGECRNLDKGGRGIFCKKSFI